MKIVYAIILALSLSGCSLFKKKPEVPAITPEVVTIDQYLLEPCPKLDKDVELTGFESVLIVHSDLLTMYVTCANKQAAGITLLKKFGNIK